MFNKRSTEHELMDDLSLATEELRKNLDELEAFNYWFGSEKLLLNAFNKIRKRYSKQLPKKIIIGDLGSGSGDLTRSIHYWAKSKKWNTEIIGIDANPFMVEYATKKTQGLNNIQFKTANILSISEMKFDIVCINSICHHFNDEELLTLLKRVSQNTHFAIIINDLHRHWFSYFTIKYLSKLLHFTDLAKNDAPLSVLRAFKKNELVALLQKQNLNHYEIRWVWPFRWQVIIWQL